jgi:hypothetical protein
MLTESYYALRNTIIDSYMVYGERDYGINLVWTDSDGSSVAFKHTTPGQHNELLKYEVPVAFCVINGGCIRYEERDYGINLVWTDELIDEWYLTGGTAGDNIPYENNRFGIYNAKIEDHVVYCERTYGINLRWSRDCARLGGGDETTFTYYLNPDPPYEGVIPFVLEWNPNPQGNASLKSIQISPFERRLLHLMKHDGNWADCGSSNGSVTLRGGDETTSEQLEDLFGTSTPSAPLSLVACVTPVNPSDLPTPFPVNITYVSD